MFSILFGENVNILSSVGSQSWPNQWKTCTCIFKVVHRILNGVSHHILKKSHKLNLLFKFTSSCRRTHVKFLHCTILCVEIHVPKKVIEQRGEMGLFSRRFWQHSSYSHQRHDDEGQQEQTRLYIRREKVFTWGNICIQFIRNRAYFQQAMCRLRMYRKFLLSDLCITIQ